MADLVSQEPVEVLIENISVLPARVSQEPVEALDQSSILRIHVSQIPIEVLVPAVGPMAASLNMRTH